MLRDIKERQGSDIDYFFIAGDLPPHDTWDQAADVHSEIIDMVAKEISEQFPGVPTFFACGNHEMAPVNVYPLEADLDQFDNRWLYDKFADVWMKWLDPQIANETIRRYKKD